MRPSRMLPGSIALAVTAMLLSLLHGCQDAPEPTEPELAVSATQKTLTLKGASNGSGVVTSSPAGINCTITASVAATTGCSARFNHGVAVTLTSVPKSGHSFKQWSSPCSGSGTCRVSMTVDRTVTARYYKGPFLISISSGVPGGGSGTVTSQPGLTPAINCAITNGTPASTGCSARYPAYTQLTFTAVPAPGSVFSGWGTPCSGTGSCQYTAVQGRAFAATFTLSEPGPVAGQGRWGALITTPVVAVHLSLLPSGKVLFWGETGESALWDPANPTAGFTQVSAPYELFCSGHTLLADGRLLVAGGHISTNYGLSLAAIFDPTAETWTQTPFPMDRGRWYPTTTVLPSGEMLVLAGSDETGATVPVPEIWNGSEWRRLTTASLDLPYYPRVFVAPNGMVFSAGTYSRYLDVTGTGAWGGTVATRNVSDRGSGSAVMYAPGKVLWAGGGSTPTASAEVIDLGQGAPAWRNVPGMTYPRRHTVATILADGKVLMTHGTGGAGNDQARAVHEPELWDPGTESWSIMAREPVIRTYHSTAMLLPDARVLSSGSGEGGNVSYANSQFSAQVFTPPYLLRPDGSLADRPIITTAPSNVSYGASITVETPDAGTTSRGTLIRLSSVTHSFNQGQHIYPLTFSAAAGSATTLVASAPPDGNHAPPGPYMLFLLNAAGVPSEARIVSVGP
ncbi:MAG: DUF1929 domain-containing protein [Gemmatimonadota bacterium]|nr:DUF1929 domain-containing protein [Gemmatimonadota bacterium]